MGTSLSSSARNITDYLWRQHSVMDNKVHSDTAETTTLRSSKMGKMLQTATLCRNLTGQPWREPSVWDDQLEKCLIIGIKEDHSHSLQNVLILGPVRAGKSSFINSTLKIFKRSKYSSSTEAGDNLLILRTFRSAEHLHGDTVFYSSDVANIGKGMDIVDSNLFVKSSMKKHTWQFSSVGTIPKPKHSQRFRHTLGTRCQIHCVIFIVSATEVIADVPENKQIKLLRQKLRQTRIPVAFVLTKVDMLCEEVGNDITKMFRSKKVLEVIETASEIFEIKKASIHPVVNLVNYLEIGTEINIPLLLALRQSLQYTSEYLEYLRIQGNDDGYDDVIRIEKEQLLFFDGCKTKSIPDTFKGKFSFFAYYLIGKRICTDLLNNNSQPASLKLIFARGYNEFV